MPCSTGLAHSGPVRAGNDDTFVTNAAGGPGNVATELARAVQDGATACGGRRAGVSGQSTVEYVMAAGILVATGLVISGILSSGARDFLRRVVHETSFLSP